MGLESTVLVTGADGFIGRALCEALAASGRKLRKAARTVRPDTANAVAVGDIGPDTDWRAALEGVPCIVHLAARTHVLGETAADPLAEYRRINVAGTERLARTAAAQGVRRFVFLSSVKVNGERTDGRPYTEDGTPRPEDAYDVSKLEAEQALARVAAETGLEVVVLRPPLVYGPGVKGNFLRLMRLVARGEPLPLGAIAEVAKLMVDAGLIVLVSFISPFRAERRMARGLFGEGEFIEVFVDAPLEECERRDPKGLYAKARMGELKNFTGIDSDYEPPEAPELHLRTDSSTPEQCVAQILRRLR